MLKTKRQLAAIMFTDIVGYSAMMQEDEEKAANLRRRHREVFENQHDLHQGKIIQYYGDGALSVFDSALEAVSCAIDIQQLFQEGDVVPVRIGIHMGDIVFSDTEVYGDGVNVAARIESLGITGSILVSGKLNDELKNHKSISTTSLGKVTLKNIQDPMHVFAITNEGIQVPGPLTPSTKPERRAKTIAVLPFVNMSASEENEYFSDGITEEIINALAKIKQLKVTSRTSSFHFKNKNIPIREIAAALNVSAILEGSIRVAGTAIRITAQLIEAEEDFHFWSETWDRQMENIFDIQDEISLEIADKLREQFGHFEIQEHLVEEQTKNLDAYDYSLKAKYHYNKWNPEDVRIAMSLYEKALALDPKHVESLVGLADSYGFLATTGFMPYEEAWTRSGEIIQQAILLDDRNAGIHYQLANLAFFAQCDYKESARQFARAVEINPNYAEAHHFMCFLHIIAGEREPALEHLDIALAINPLSQETLFFQAYYHYMTEDYATALTELEQCLAVNDKNLPAHSIKTYCLLKLGHYDEVLNYYDRLPQEIVVEGDRRGTQALAYAYKKDAEQTDLAMRHLEEAAKSPEGFREDSFLFLLYAATRSFDKAFEWVQKSIDNKSSFLLFHYCDPLAMSLREDPRYEKYKKTIFPAAKPQKATGSKKDLLDRETVDAYAEQLLNHIRREKPYLNPDLTLRALAGEIDIHPNQLSWLLNNELGKSFNEFINHFRVKTFKEIALLPKNEHLSIIGLAFESGFNSKTVFNTYFKKETGMTPGQFIKSRK